MADIDRVGNHPEPKYKLLASEIIGQIEEGKFEVNEKIPSIKHLAKTYQMSRETVSKALNLLSEQGIVKAVYRQGYFVQTTNVKLGLRIFFLIDKITEFKNRMIESFLNTIGDHGEVHIFFHHHNYEVFKSLILKNLKKYTHFVITSYIEEDIEAILNAIPPEKRVILDNYEGNLSGNYTMVYQDFEMDIYNCLKKAYPRLKKYKRLVLVSAHSRWGADKVIKGVTRFGKDYNLDIELTDDINKENFQKESVYIFLANSNKKMVDTIKLYRSLDYKIGKDFGIISYNNTYENEVLAGGISVINTDFTEMGKTAARLILKRKKTVVVNPSKLILRDSI